MNDLFKVNEKVVVVTGATGILAGGAAQYLQKNGATVVYMGRNRTKLIESCQRPEKFPTIAWV